MVAGRPPQAIGVSQQTVSRWENRVYPVRLKYVAPLVRELGVDEDELLAAVHARTEEPVHDDGPRQDVDPQRLYDALVALDDKVDRLLELVQGLHDR
jgi:transcriptional regulator with XRE-family HTH domain